jgi:protoporphyrinogen oxidase
MTLKHYDLIVVGAGAMGLAAAYEAQQHGKKVLVLEAGKTPGGMAAHFNIGDLSIERYYHFICKTDYDTFELLQELGIQDMLKWRSTKMGYFYQGKNYKWGNPLALLAFPKLNPIEKLRYALMALWCTKRKNWDKVESLTAPVWLKRWLGERGYQKLWQRLFYLKFYNFTEEISATWIGTRIRRIGLSRKSMMEEQLGYLVGGTKTLVKALTDSIESRNGEILCSQPVKEIAQASDGKLCTVISEKEQYIANKVICTVPTPHISRLVPSLPEHLKAQYDAIPNIGVCCLIFNLKKQVTPNFWHNVIDDRFNIPGIIEFSNLRYIDSHIVYVPYYMPHDQERWTWSDEDLLEEAFTALKAINPNIETSDIIDSKVSRLKYSQPICKPNFLETLPAVQSPITGLQIADTCYYYPEDRGISESIKFGRNMSKSAFA